jgi:hypothetical protein
MKNFSKSLMLRYAQRIGKENFIRGYYYSRPETRYKLVIKALNMDIMNLQDKLQEENKLKALFECNQALIDKACFITDAVYLQICK